MRDIKTASKMNELINTSSSNTANNVGRVDFSTMSATDFHYFTATPTTSTTTTTTTTTTILGSLNDTITVDVNATEQPTAVILNTNLSLNYEMPAMIMVAVVLFVIIVITVFGNFLVGVALFKFRYLRTVSNFLIGNLALSDFLLALTILPLSTINECLGQWVFGQIMCNVWLLTDVLYCTASIWNLCIIAFDRFTATLYPVWYREKRNTKQAAIYISIVWVFSSCISVPPLLGWYDLTQNYVYHNTTDTYHCFLFQTPSYVLYSASGSFFIPFFITVFLYIRIFSVLRERMRKMRGSSRAYQIRKQQAASNAHKEKEKPLLNSLAITETEIEMTQSSPITNDGSGNTEELSSKSLFGSDSDGHSEDDEDDDDEDDEEAEDSSMQLKSDNPLYVSSSETERTSGTHMKNGVKHKTMKNMGGGEQRDSETVVILNPGHQFSESDKEMGSDMEHVRIIITHEDDENKNTDSKKPARKAKSVKIKKPENSGTTEQQQQQQQQSSKRTANIGSVLKSVNPFKAEKRRARSTSQKHRYEQREMRATIRMAIIIAFFCGMWLGFFMIYVIAGFCTQCYIPRELDAFFFWLGYLNSCINPILYTIFNEEFRKAFQKILGCYTKRRHGHRH